MGLDHLQDGGGTAWGLTIYSMGLAISGMSAGKTREAGSTR